MPVTRMDGQALLLRFTRGSDVVPEGPTGFPFLDDIAAGAIRNKRGIIYAARLLVRGVQRTRMGGSAGYALRSEQSSVEAVCWRQREEMKGARRAQCGSARSR